ncbi:probable G-protein coupled receptor 139 isoform X2 [Stegostoma tigrinum]|uniref:probable G-protein coupled receptor 139 isoform X2 n=1 Tax=Stegostoma tigrinum TaxID=3053191 RepID=UPI00286FE6C8|nr:probable G-protein coupled receptor 139 isoform X2 [Stegostoma tigrinum]
MNVLQLFGNIQNPSTREVTHHPGLSFVAIEISTCRHCIILSKHSIGSISCNHSLECCTVQVNFVTILILSRGKCDLSKCVTLYLVAMAVADLLVIIFDLIFRHIPIVYREHFHFWISVPVCNIHAVLLCAATDCSVWFTVSFTFDRLVAICCQKLKSKYCTERTAAVILGIVTALSCMKNIFWYFMLSGNYFQVNLPWFCNIRENVYKSMFWVTIEFLHHILTPCCPFILILLFNIITVRNILLTSRAHRKLHASRSGRDPEMENWRKSIILLFILSANFIILWSTLMVFSIWYRMFSLGYYSISLHVFVLELGFLLQLLSCCTNTGIYAVTQTKFRKNLVNVIKFPFTAIIKLIVR